jgi:hypothetical protein
VRELAALELLDVRTDFARAVVREGAHNGEAVLIDPRLAGSLSAKQSPDSPQHKTSLASKVWMVRAIEVVARDECPKWASLFARSASQPGYSMVLLVVATVESCALETDW